MYIYIYTHTYIYIYILLIHKLQEFGLPSKLISLISNYLDGRTQCVYLKPHGVRSPITSCDVGVPQGPLLGPTLWQAFVDSLQFSEGSVVKYIQDTTSFFPLRLIMMTLHKKHLSKYNSTQLPPGKNS